MQENIWSIRFFPGIYLQKRWINSHHILGYISSQFLKSDSMFDMNMDCGVPWQTNITIWYRQTLPSLKKVSKCAEAQFKWRPREREHHPSPMPFSGAKMYSLTMSQTPPPQAILSPRENGMGGRLKSPFPQNCLQCNPNWALVHLQTLFKNRITFGCDPIRVWLRGTPSPNLCQTLCLVWSEDTMKIFPQRACNLQSIHFTLPF